MAQSETAMDRIDVVIASSKSSSTQTQLEVFRMAHIIHVKWEVRGSSFLPGAVNLVNGRKKNWKSDVGIDTPCSPSHDLLPQSNTSAPFLQPLHQNHAQKRHLDL